MDLGSETWATIVVGADALVVVVRPDLAVRHRDAYDAFRSVDAGDSDIGQGHPSDRRAS